MIGCRTSDIIYSPLPLYHSVAGMIALAGTLGHGISMVMTVKFSASSFWADCVKYNVTVGVFRPSIRHMTIDVTIDKFSSFYLFKILPLAVGFIFCE